MDSSDSDMLISDEDQPCSNLQNQLSERRSELKACRKEKAGLENVNRDLRLRLSMAELKPKRSTGNRDFQKQIDHCMNLETKLNECRSELTASRQENKETVDAKNILKVELEIEQEKTRELKESIFWLERELKDSKCKLELSENALMEARQKEKEAQKKSTEWSEKTCKLEAVLECEMEISKTRLEEVQVLETKLSEARQKELECCELWKKFDELKDSSNEKDNILVETTQKLAETVSHLEKAQVRGSDMEAQLTRQREEVDTLRQKVTFYRQTCKVHEQDCAEHISSLAKFEREIEQLRKSEMELRQQNTELRSQSGESENQIRQLKQKLTVSEATIARLETNKKLETTVDSQRLKHQTPVSRSKKHSSLAYTNEEPAEAQSDIECRNSILRTLEPSTSPSPDSVMCLKAPRIMVASIDSSGGARPKRNRVKPLKFWANQTVVYKYDEDGLPEARGVSEVKIDSRRRSEYSLFMK